MAYKQIRDQGELERITEIEIFWLATMIYSQSTNVKRNSMINEKNIYF